MKRFISFKAVKAIGILALLLTFSVLSQAQSPPIPCCTHFDGYDTAGYQGILCHISLRTPGPSGAPGDVYLHAIDDDGASYILAGSDCIGDWSPIAASQWGGTLCFDVKMFYDGCETSIPECKPYNWLQIHPSCAVKSGSIRAQFIVTNPAYITDPKGNNPGWHHICAPIDFAVEVGPGTWLLPHNTYGYWLMLEGVNSDWNGLIANVTEMHFPIEFVANPAEEAGYDNICLRINPGPPPGGDWIKKELTLHDGGWAVIGVGAVLKGNVSITWHFDGWSYDDHPQDWGWFGSYDDFVDGGNTHLEWTNFHDAVNGVVDDGQTVCIGWSPPGKVDYFYWIVSKHAWPAIEQVAAYGVTNGEYWESIRWHNVFMMNPGIPDSTITLRDVQFAAFSAPVNPDSLDHWNVALENALQPISSDTAPIPLPYGQDVTLPFPTPIPSDQWVVVRYRVESPNSAAEVIDYVMLRPKTGGDIPTLTEWGLIIFGVVLLGFISWVFVKRRKVIGVRL